jgi:hypothetical protein
MMRCIICHFDVPDDDARILFHRRGDGAPEGTCICIGCSARVLHTPEQHMSQSLEREIAAILRGTT